VAKWADEGAEITFCIATDGSTGTQDKTLMGRKLNEVRIRETEAAAKILGATEVTWLDHLDGYVEYTLDLRRDIARVFRKYRPHRFVVLDPTPTIEDRFINHPDHRAVGQACLDVSMTAGTTPGIFPELLEEGLEPWRGLRELWIMGPGGGPRVVDTSTTIQRKIDALLCHRSQVGEDQKQVGEWVRDRGAQLGAAHGYEYAESFRVIKEGPGFHAGEQDKIELDIDEPPVDPRSARPPAGSV
jgi:LmbE family N-acetylglucosaminyl deacetylase